MEKINPKKVVRLLREEIESCCRQLLAVGKETGDAYLGLERGPVRASLTRINRLMITLARVEKRSLFREFVNKVARKLGAGRVFWNKWGLLHEFGDGIDQPNFKGLFFFRLAAAVQNVVDMDQHFKNADGRGKSILILSTGPGYEMLAFRLGGYTNVVATNFPKSRQNELLACGEYAVRFEKIYDLIREEILGIREGVFPLKIEPPDFAVFPKDRRFDVLISNELAVLQFLNGPADARRFFQNCMDCAEYVFLEGTAVKTQRVEAWLVDVLENMKTDGVEISWKDYVSRNITDGPSVVRKDIIMARRGQE